MKMCSVYLFPFHANQTHFHMKGFARRLVLKQRHKVTWKWPADLEIKKGVPTITLGGLIERGRELKNRRSKGRDLYMEGAGRGLKIRHESF